jgi:hydrogenase maturation protease
MREVGSCGLRTPVLVLGIGNPLRGDDGIGPRLVEELVRLGLPEEVTALDVGTGGLDLFRVLEGWERAVIVDAADVGREPGRIVRFAPDQVRLALAMDGFSLHHAGLGEVIALADALGQTLPKMTVFGVQPAEFDWREGLSPAVEAALPGLVDAVIEAIEE